MSRDVLGPEEVWALAVAPDTRQSRVEELLGVFGVYLGTDLRTLTRLLVEDCGMRNRLNKLENKLDPTQGNNSKLNQADCAFLLTRLKLVDRRPMWFFGGQCSVEVEEVLAAIRKTLLDFGVGARRSAVGTLAAATAAAAGGLPGSSKRRRLPNDIVFLVLQRLHGDKVRAYEASARQRAEAEGSARRRAEAEGSQERHALGWLSEGSTSLDVPLLVAHKKRPLSASEATIVDSVFQSAGVHLAKVVAAFKLSRISTVDMTPYIMRCLNPRKWLNDEVMDVYLHLVKMRTNQSVAVLLPALIMYIAPALADIVQEYVGALLTVHVLSSFFSTKLEQGGYGGVKRWSKLEKVKILNYDMIFAPWHVDANHWCLAVINVKEKRFEYYDSLGGGAGNVLQLLRSYVVGEAKTYCGQPDDYNVDDWTDLVPKNIPQQNNGYDCGVFTLKYADFLSASLPLTFDQEDMPLFRRRIAAEILAKEVI